MLATAAVTAAFAVAFVRYLDDSYYADLWDSAVLISLAYPVLDVALLVVADHGYNVMLANGTFSTGTLIDACWLAFFVFVAAAALHTAASSSPTGHAPTSGDLAPVGPGTARLAEL